MADSTDELYNSLITRKSTNINASVLIAKDFVKDKRNKTKDKPAIVVELKCNQDAGTAIQQIKDRKYGEHLKDYTGKVLLVGINYQKEDKNKTHTCVIEELEK